MLESLKCTYRERKAARSAALRSRRRGISMFLIGGSMVMILGFAALSVDFGLLTIDKNRAQRAVDAAALAGAQELKDTDKAHAVAKDVAAENGVPVTDADITFLDEDSKIRVTASDDRNLYFARVIGIPTKTVGASAVAGITGGPTETVAAPLPVPIGITTTTVDAYTDPLNTNPIALTLPRLVDEPYTINSFIVFDLRTGNSKSPSHMESQLTYGHAASKVGDRNTSLNASDGNVNERFVRALSARFQQSAESPWNDTWTGNVSTSNGIRYLEIVNGTARADNPRVMFLVVNEPAAQSGGTSDHEVLKFQPVYVEGWQNGQLIVRFFPPDFDGTSTIVDESALKSVSLIR